MASSSSYKTLLPPRCRNLSTEARQSVSEACQELGIGLRVTKVGTSDVASKPLLDPQADADLLAELAEIERTMKEVGDFDDVQGSHCNKQHIPGCPNAYRNNNRNAREGKTKPQKQRNQEPKKTREPKEPVVQRPKFALIDRPSKSFDHQKQVIAQKAKTYGIPGQGYTAPGMQEEFFVSNRSGREMRYEEHVKKSADRISHLTASEHVDDLWQVSHPLRKERDRYIEYKKSPIEWVHKRVAYMAIKGQKYEVTITAKEFKDSTPNILYQVQTRAIK